MRGGISWRGRSAFFGLKADGGGLGGGFWQERWFVVERLCKREGGKQRRSESNPDFHTTVLAF